jgi:hypothetical protein
VITLPFRSNVPIFEPWGAAAMHGTVTSGSRPSIASVPLWAAKYAFTFATVPGMSDFAFGIRSVSVLPLNVFLTPFARSVRPELLASWMITTTDFAPAALNCLPAPSPAISSSCPTWHMYVFWIAATLSKASSPELTVMISMPRFAAELSAPVNALASGTDVAITFTLAATAALMPATCLAMSLLA